MSSDIQFSAGLDTTPFDRGLQRIEREMDRVRNKATDLQTAYDTTQQQLSILRADRSIDTKEAAAIARLEKQGEREYRLIERNNQRLQDLQRNHVEKMGDLTVAQVSHAERAVEKQQQIQQRAAAAQNSQSRRLAITGATQVAGAAGVPIPGGASALSLGPGFAAVAAATAATAAIRAAITSTSEWITEMQHLSRATGATAQDVSAFTIAAESTGVSGKGAASALTALSESTKNNGEAFAKLGIRLSEADGSARPLLDVFTDLQARLRDASSDAERNAIAQQLVGSSYKELNNILDMTPAKFTALIEKSKQSSRVVGDDAVLANNRFIASMKQVEDVTESVGAKLGRWFSDSITGSIANVKHDLDALGSILQSVRTKGLLGTIADIPGIQADAKKRSLENRAQIEREAEEAAKKGKGPTGPGLPSTEVPAAVQAFRNLTPASQRAFSSVSVDAANAGRTIRREFSGALQEVEERYKALADLDQVSGDAQQALKVADALGLSPEAIRSIFDAATGMIGLGMEELKAKAREQQYDTLSALIKKITVGNLERDLEGVDGRIAAIDESLLRMTERAEDVTDKVKKDVDQFDSGALSAELRAREEERLFIPTRPGDDKEDEKKGGPSKAEQREREKLLRERGVLEAKRGQIASALEAAQVEARRAQAIIDAAKVADAAAVAAKAADDAQIARHTTIIGQLHEQKALRTELLENIDTAWDRKIATEGKVEHRGLGGEMTTQKIIVDVVSSDGSVNSLAVDSLAGALTNAKLISGIQGAIVRVRRHVPQTGTAEIQP